MSQRIARLGLFSVVLVALASFAPTAHAQIISIQQSGGGTAIDLSTILNGTTPLTIPFNSSTPEWNVINNTGSTLDGLSFVFDGSLDPSAGQLNCQTNGSFAGGSCELYAYGSSTPLGSSIHNPGIPSEVTLVYSFTSQSDVAPGGEFEIKTSSFAHAGNDGGCIAGVPVSGTGSGAAFTCTPTTVPLPAAWPLAISGLALLGGIGAVRRKRASTAIEIAHA